MLSIIISHYHIKVNRYCKKKSSNFIFLLTEYSAFDKISVRKIKR